MFFADPATKNAAICITLDRTHYTAGETVRGTVRITAKDSLEITALVVVATGTEAVNWNDNPTPSIFGKKEQECFKQKIAVTLPNLFLDRGEESAAHFECLLPRDVAGSIEIPSTCTPTSMVKYATASIAYQVEAAIEFLPSEPQNDKKKSRALQLLTKQRFTVYECNDALQPTPRENAMLNAPVRSCCFGAHGKCDFHVQIASDVTHVGDRVQVQVDFKNDSSAPIPAITCRLIQVTTLQLPIMEHVVEREIGAWMYRQIAPNEHVVRPHVFTVASTDAQSPLVCPTSVKGAMVQSRYVIQVDAYIKGSTDLELRLPLTVLAPHKDATIGTSVSTVKDEAVKNSDGA